MSNDGKRSVFVPATIPGVRAAMLTNILLADADIEHQAAAAAERGTHPGNDGHHQSGLGQAFCNFLETVADADVPESVGTRRRWWPWQRLGRPIGMCRITAAAGASLRPK